MKTSLCLAAAVLGALACSSSSSTSSPSSTVEGTIAASSFALSAPTAVDAVDETGARQHAELGAGGAFRLTLTKGHVYRLVALTPKGEEAVVFPRAGGRLEKTFRVSSGAAVVALGSVRHFDAVPVAGFSVAESSKTECENGQAGADNQSDGECENGKDAKTGAACNDAEGEVADPAEPMAVPEKNPPSDISGCEDGTNDGETED